MKGRNGPPVACPGWNLCMSKTYIPGTGMKYERYKKNDAALVPGVNTSVGGANNGDGVVGGVGDTHTHVVGGAGWNIYLRT